MVKSTRVEEVEFQLQCSGKLSEEYRLKLQELGIKISAAADDDIMRINYRLLIEYFGRVEAVLRVFIKMIDNGAIITGDLASEGEILIKRILESLYELRKRKN